MKNLIFLVFVSVFSTNLFAKNTQPASRKIAAIENLDQLGNECLLELVQNQSAQPSCELYETISRRLDSKIKADQCRLDKTRDISTLEIQDCINKFKLAKIAAQMNGVESLAIPTSEKCKEYIRAQNCE